MDPGWRSAGIGLQMDKTGSFKLTLLLAT